VDIAVPGEGAAALGTEVCEAEPWDGECAPACADGGSNVVAALGAADRVSEVPSAVARLVELNKAKGAEGERVIGSFRTTGPATGTDGARGTVVSTRPD